MYRYTAKSDQNLIVYCKLLRKEVSIHCISRTMTNALKEIKQRSKYIKNQIAEYKLNKESVLFQAVRKFASLVNETVTKEFLVTTYMNTFGTTADNDLVYDLLGWSNEDNTIGRRMRIWCTTAVLTETLRLLDEE